MACVHVGWVYAIQVSGIGSSTVRMWNVEAFQVVFLSETELIAAVQSGSFGLLLHLCDKPV